MKDWILGERSIFAIQPEKSQQVREFSQSEQTQFQRFFEPNLVDLFRENNTAVPQPTQ